MTPKSLLRHPALRLDAEDAGGGRFSRVARRRPGRPGARAPHRVPAGKLYYDLLKARDEQRIGDVALVRLEQLYPFPAAELALGAAAVRRGARGRLGAGGAAQHGRLAVRPRAVPGRRLRDSRRVVRYVGREESASPAPGSHKVHVAEQEAIVAEALRASAETPLAVRQAAPATS